MKSKTCSRTQKTTTEAEKLQDAPHVSTAKILAKKSSEEYYLERAGI